MNGKPCFASGQIILLPVLYRCIAGCWHPCVTGLPSRSAWRSQMLRAGCVCLAILANLTFASRQGRWSVVGGNCGATANSRIAQQLTKRLETEHRG